MYDSALGLIPAFDVNSDRGQARLEDLNSRDITLDAFLRFFLESNIPNWKWINATSKDVQMYAHHALESFCDDYEKIRRTQDMVHTCMAENTLREFLLRGSNEFERYDLNGDYRYTFSLCLEGLVLALHDKFESITTEHKVSLQPLSEHLSNVKNSEVFLQIQEFNKLFIKPMEFTCYLGSHPAFGGRTKQLVQGKFYSEDSSLLREVKQDTVCLHDASCVIFGDQGEIKTSELPILATNDEPWNRTLSRMTNIFMSEVLGVTLEQFIFEVIPDYTAPLKVVIKIEREKSQYKLFLTLDDVPEGYSLATGEHNPRAPTAMVLKYDPMHEVFPKATERNELQRKLIGQTKIAYVYDKYGSSSFVYHMKAQFFFSTFFKKCQDIGREFGKYLVELRYLAFVAEQFRLIGREARIVFPKLLPKEDNVTKIMQSENPVLVLDHEYEPLVIPNDVSINETCRVQIITGPNQNGKTRYIDTIALNQIFCQAGWPVFAKEALMSPKTDLRVHYVHSGVGIKGESRFSHECQRMTKVFTEMHGAYPLIIIDEPYTGTNYNDAETLLKELLQACSDEDISIFLTTHFHGLISFIEVMPNGRNLHCYVDDDGRFTYQIREGSSTKSNALEVAENAGARFDQLVAVIQAKKNPPEPQPVTSSEDDGGVDDLPF